MISSYPFPPLEIVNTTNTVLEISVEVYPDRYLLHPGDVMAIEADPDGAPFSIHPFVGGLQIFAGNTAGAVVTINGHRAEPDWSKPN
jgi:hypothetical protein